MPLYIIFLIPVFSIMISFAAIFAMILSLKNQKKNLLNKLIDDFSSEKHLDFLNNESEISSEIEGQLDNRLDAIINGFKKQIPMIGMFLSQTKEDELKATAKTELLKLIPGIKNRFITKVNEILKPVDDSLEKLLTQKLEKIFDNLCEQIKYKIFIRTFATGLIFGVIEIGIIYFLAN